MCGTHHFRDLYWHVLSHVLVLYFSGVPYVFSYEYNRTRRAVTAVTGKYGG